LEGLNVTIFTHPNQKMKKYKNYLRKFHSKLVTPNEIIDGVVEEATGSKTKKKERIIAGEINEIYNIVLENEENVIVKITKGGDMAQYEREDWAFKACKNIGGIPIPELLFVKNVVGESQTLSLCVQRKLLGSTLKGGKIDFGKYNKNRQKRIIYKAGEILSKIHTIKTKGFGYLNANGIGSYSTYSQLMSEYVKDFDKYLSLSTDIGMPKKSMQKIFSILIEKEHTAPKLSPILSHNDYTLNHIMVNSKDEITGIIDWGEAEGHSPVNDFAKWSFWVEEIPIEWLQEGYSNKRIFDREYEDMLHWSRLSIGIGALSWYYVRKYRAGIKEVTQKLLRDLEYYG
jgi:hypothetical protein